MAKNDVGHRKISNDSLKAKYDGYWDGQKKWLIGHKLSLLSKGNFITGPHGLLFEPLDQNRTKVDQNMTRVQSKSVEFHNYY